MAQQIIRSIGSDGKEVLSNILDRYTGEQLTYKEVALNSSNVAISDVDIDGVVYIKKYDKYYCEGVFYKERVVNVRSFGATGDGVTDDTAAIKRCLSFINSTISSVSITVYFPQGTYIITEELLIDRSFVKIKGDGFRSIIKAGAAIRSIFKLNDSNQNNRSFYESLCLHGAGLADYCFNGINSHHTRISKCRFMGSKVSAILLSGWCNDIVDCEVSYNSGDGISILNQNNNAVNILRNRIFLNEGIGVHVRSGIKVTISGNTIEGNKKTGIYIQLVVRSLSIINNYFEANAKDGFLFTTPDIKVHSTIILNGSTNASVISAAYNSVGVDISNNSMSSHVQDAVMIFTSGTEGGKIHNNISFNVPDNGGEVLGVYLDTLRFSINQKKLNLENNIATNVNSTVTHTNGIRVYGISATRPNLSLLTDSNSQSNKNYINNNVLSMTLISDAASGYVRRSANKYLGKEAIDLGSDVSGSSKSFGWSISVDDYPELAGKLLNFEFKVQSNTEGTGMSYGVLGSSNYNRNQSFTSAGWQDGGIFILMPTTGIIRLYVRKTGNPGSVSIADPILKIVGVDSNIFYTTTIPPIWKAATPPTTGQWNVGDVIWKTNPSINTNTGWVHDGSSFVEFGKQIQIGTQAEVNAGADNTKAVTSLTLETKLKQGTVPAITTPDAADEAAAITLANANKAKINEIITKLSTIIFK